MKSTYSEAFIEQAVSKALARGSRPITEISRDLNVPYHTLRKWLGKSSMSKRGEFKSRERRPGDWSPEEQLQALRSEEHTSELQSLMRISYAVFCLKKKKIKK